MSKDLIAILPELVLSVGAMLTLMIGVFLERKTNVIAITPALSVIFLILAAGSLLFVKEGSLIAFNNMFIADGFSIFAKATIIFSAGIVVIMSTNYLEKPKTGISFEYPILIMLSVVGMLIMVSANDMLTLYLGLEIQSLSMYVLAAIKRDDSRASEAGMKYFVLGALASGILLYGISLIYGFTGTTNFTGIAEALGTQTTLPTGILVGLIMVFIALCFKISAAPFHMWTPDVYEGVPTIVTAYFAIVPKLAIACVFIRISQQAFGGYLLDWRDVVITASIFSMAVGAFAGIWQKNLKRLLAYSSIGHVGYAILGIAALSLDGISAVLIYFLIYIITSIALFGIILSIDVKDRNGENGIERIEHLNGLARKNPIIALALTFLMFSMMGIPVPPYPGFFGKFFVFSAAVQNGLNVVAVVGVLLSVVAAFYYLRIVKVMYFDNLPEGVEVNVKVPIHTATIIIAITILSAVLFLQPALIADPAMAAAQNLF